MNEDGTLAVRGRVTEVIVTGGEKVWPDAVEGVLAAHGGVAEVAVWKRPDPEWGERVVAWVVPTQRQPGPEELVDLVKATLAPWAAPKEVVFTTALPAHRLGQGHASRPALSPAGSGGDSGRAPSARSSRMVRSCRPISRGLPDRSASSSPWASRASPG